MIKFITDFGDVPTILDPIRLLCDNNGAIAQSKEPRSHHKSKHILSHFYLIREIVAKGDVVTERVPSTDNVTDPLTKPLAQEVFERHCTTMGSCTTVIGFSPSERLTDIMWPISRSHFDVSRLC